MNSKEQLIEQHVREYESRLKHIDELYQRAREAASNTDPETEAASKLKQFKKQRKLLRKTTDQLKAIPLDHWREETVRSAGPMAVWDIIAQSLEDFVERHE